MAFEFLCVRVESLPLVFAGGVMILVRSFPGSERDGGDRQAFAQVVQPYFDGAGGFGGYVHFHGGGGLAAGLDTGDHEPAALR